MIFKNLTTIGVILILSSCTSIPTKKPTKSHTKVENSKTAQNQNDEVQNLNGTQNQNSETKLIKHLELPKFSDKDVPKCIADKQEVWRESCKKGKKETECSVFTEVLGIACFVTGDYATAKAILKIACYDFEDVSGFSCAYLAQTEEHFGNSEQEKEAYSRSCNKNNGWGCLFLGKNTFDLKKFTEAYSKSRFILNEACNRGEPNACNTLPSVKPMEINSKIKFLKIFLTEGCNHPSDYMVDLCGDLGDFNSLLLVANGCSDLSSEGCENLQNFMEAIIEKYRLRG